MRGVEVLHHYNHPESKIFHYINTTYLQQCILYGEYYDDKHFFKLVNICRVRCYKTLRVGITGITVMFNVLIIVFIK